MSAAFTPGPWSLSVTDKIVTAEGERVADAWLGREEWPANARLIAAAPELYEALEALVDEHDDWPEAIKAKQALAKARGEA